jgi:glutathione peroxidase
MTKLVLIIAMGTFMILGDSANAAEKAKKTPPVLNFTMKSIDGKPVKLSKYAGKVVLIVNVASECGLTDQYGQLQALHQAFGKEGLAILGVPCNQFGSQEPGTEAEIKKFCKANYGVTFDMLAKVDVNGEKACGLYKHLTLAKTKPVGPGKIGWNFEKFLLDRNGNVIARFDPNTSPDDEKVVASIKKALAN